MAKNEFGKFFMPEWVASQPSPLQLEVFKDGMLSETIDLGGKLHYIMGRSREHNDIVLDNTSISRQHAAIVHGTPPDCHSQACHFVVDLGSSCGSFIQEGNSPQQLQPYNFKALTHGCMLTFGESTREYKVRIEGGAAAAKPKSHFAPSADNPLAGGRDDRGGGKSGGRSPAKRMQIQAASEFEDKQRRKAGLAHPPTPTSRMVGEVIDVDVGNGFGGGGGRGRNGKGGGGGGRNFGDAPARRGRDSDGHERGRDDDNRRRSNSADDKKKNYDNRNRGRGGGQGVNQAPTPLDLALYPGDIVQVAKLKGLTDRPAGVGSADMEEDNCIAEILFAGAVQVDGRGRVPLIGLRFPRPLPLTKLPSAGGGLALHPSDGVLPREIAGGGAPRRYFRCRPGHGLYITPAECRLQPSSMVPPEVRAALRKQGLQAPRKHDRILLPPEIDTCADFNLDRDTQAQGLVGMDVAMAYLRTLRNRLEVARKREAFGIIDSRPLHLLAFGSPGLCYSTLALVLARLLRSMGSLPTGHVVMAGREDLVGVSSEETTEKCEKEIERARGGVLLIIDTPALLKDGDVSDRYGHLVLQTLSSHTAISSGDGNSEVLLMLVGKRAPLGKILDVVPALSRLFEDNNRLDLPDYSTEQMSVLFKQAVKDKGFLLDRSLSDDKTLTGLLKESFDSMKGLDGGENSENNGLVMRVLESVIRRQTDRVYAIGTCSKNSLLTLTAQDFEDGDKDGGEGEGEEGEGKKGEAMRQLMAVIGLSAVKEHMQTLNAKLMVDKERRRAGMEVGAGTTLHMIFTGNPGTGKTTVARLVAGLLRELGYLKRGHLVEADRAALVAGYSGQTALKVREVVDSAMGGVLFVDEAYALVSDDRDSFGREALDTLIKLVEDRRADLVVILAGYAEDMTTLLSRNPGVKSRFPTVVDFADYDASELMDIMRSMLKSYGLELHASAVSSLQTAFAHMAAVHDKENGNGRAVRNILEAAVRKQALRIASNPSANAQALSGTAGGRRKEELRLLVAEDFVGLPTANDSPEISSAEVSSAEANSTEATQEE